MDGVRQANGWTPEGSAGQQGHAILVPEEEEGALRNLLEQSPDAALILNLVDQERLVLEYLNAPALRLVPGQSENYRGMLLEVVLPFLARTEVPAQLQATALGGTPLMVSDFGYEEYPLQGIYDVRAVRVAPCRVVVELVEVSSRRATEQRIRERLEWRTRQQETLLLLSTDPAVTGGDFALATRVICEYAGNVMGVDRASVWLFDDATRELVCYSGYDRTRGVYVGRDRLWVADFPEYVEALAAGRALPIHDVETDPRATGLRVVYSDRHNIGAYLDAPVRIGGRLVGVICHEHVGCSRQWSSLETAFAGQLADQVAQAFMHAERKRTEQTLKEDSAFRQAIIENASEGLCVCSTVEAAPHLLFTVWNARMVDITGYTLEEINSLGWFQALFPNPGERAAAVERFARIRLGDNIRHEEWEMVRKDGLRRVVSISTTSLPGTDGETVMLGLLQDVTERTRQEEQRLSLERQLQHAQKLESLGVLAGGIAHDFNNLLMGILGNAELARMELPPSSPSLGFLRDLETAAHRAADLCRQMLAYSGKGQFVVQLVDVNELISEMSQLLRVSVSKKAMLRCQLSQDLPQIRADSTQIHQVFMNLITNAADAIGDRSGVVIVSTREVMCAEGELPDPEQPGAAAPAGRYVCCEVTDTGAGMSNEVRERMFDPFYTTKFTGRGLGLAAVLGIVRGHGGAIRVDSEEGRGTRISVYFPAIDIPKANEAAEPVEVGGEGLTEGGKILVVDDESSVRFLAERMVEHLGFESVGATDGVEGLEIFKRDPDKIIAVLLDLTMPRMDGEETLRCLRDINADIPVILMSGYSEADISSRFEGLKPKGFLQKPFQLAALEAKLMEVLQKR